MSGRVRAPEASSLHAQALAANDAGRPRDAARLLRRALNSLAAQPEPDQLLRGRILITYALCEAELHGMDRGLAQLGEVDELVRAGLATPELRVALANQRGLLHARSGRLADALLAFDGAEPYLADAPALQRCKVWLNRALARLGSGELGRARHDLHRCAELAETAGFPELQAKALYNEGYLEFLAGDLPRALALMDRADRIEADGDLGIVLLDRARVLVEAGLDREADRTLEEAGEIFARTGANQDLGEVELARAECALLAGEPDAARRLAVQARGRFRRRGNERWLRTADRVVVAADLMRGRASPALVRRAEQLAEELRAEGLAVQSRAVAFLAVEALLDLGQPTEGLRLAERAGPARRGDPISARLDTRYLRARLRWTAGARSSAAREIRTGLRELADYQASFGSLDLQTASAVHGRRLAELGVSIALDGGSPNRVLAALERGRAVSSRLPSVRPPADEQTAALLAELRQTVEDLRDGGPATALQGRRRELERTIRARSWTLAGAGDIVEPAANSAIRAGLARTESTLVCLARVGAQLHAVAVTDRGARLYRLGPIARTDALAQRIRADLDVLAHALLPDGLRAAATGSLLRSLDALDELVFAPLGRPDGRVVIAPTGALAAVPWGSLPSRRGNPTTVAPSATAWLGALQDHPAHPGPSDPARLRVVALAGPGLARAGDEAFEVAATWQAAGSSASSSAGATRDSLGQALATASVVHVAAHGTHQPQNPLFSAVRLADGPLFAHELEHSAEHVVLSACELGLAAVRPGDEALGLTSVLLHRGTRCVVAGVARVADDLAAETMLRYHRGLAGGLDSAQALADALAAEAGAPTPFVCFGAQWSAERFGDAGGRTVG